MTWTDRIRARLMDPGARRWLIAGGAVLILHILALAVLPPNPRLNRYQTPTERIVAPIFLDITPNARRAQTPSLQPDAAGTSSPVDQPPIAVRPASPSPAPQTVPPLVVDTPPVPIRSRAPGRVIPQSWRRRCGLGDGEVSQADWQACRDLVLQASAPSDPPVRRRGDPAQDFAAQGAARIAAYESHRALAPTGSGNARSSATPGSNFGMGEIDRSIVYGVGERPVVNGGID